MDEYELCPQWSRLGFCHNKPEFMNFNCRESCGSCGFKSCKSVDLWLREGQIYLLHIIEFSANNQENQVVNGKQVTDMSSKEDFSKYWLVFTINFE